MTITELAVGYTFGKLLLGAIVTSAVILGMLFLAGLVVIWEAIQNYKRANDSKPDQGP